MSRLPSRVEAIIKIADKIRNLSPDVSTEGLFVKHPTEVDLFLLLPWEELTLDKLKQVKVELRRGDDFKIGPRRYLDAEQRLVNTIGIAFANPELLAKFGLEISDDGTVSPITK